MIWETVKIAAVCQGPALTAVFHCDVFLLGFPFKCIGGFFSPQGGSVTSFRALLAQLRFPVSYL